MTRLRWEWWTALVATGVAGGAAYLALRTHAPRTAERYREIDRVLARSAPPPKPTRRPLLERLRDERVIPDDDATEYATDWTPKRRVA